MSISRQHQPVPAIKGASARTRRLMLATARQMMKDGKSPSVSEVAEAAEVSRSTAYRYFPTVPAMVHAVVSDTLGPILDWDSESDDPIERVRSLFRTSFSGIAANETTFRAALRVALEKQEDPESNPQRGHRRALLQHALKPVGELPESSRIINALSMLFGIESLIVLRDICGLNTVQAEEVAIWAAEALVAAHLENSEHP